ncbi:MAG: right-handed parallel beta-helix repeat-containing protein, partial [Promethearchaeota archaeon]
MKQFNRIFNSLLFASIILISITSILYRDNLRSLETNESVPKIKIPPLRNNLNSSQYMNFKVSSKNFNETIAYMTSAESNDLNVLQDDSTNFRIHEIIITNPTDDPGTVQAANGSEVGISRLNEDIDLSEKDIIINDTTIWQNIHLTVNHTIIVNSSILRLVNITLTFNCTTSFWGIKVIGNGELHLINSTIKSINRPSLIVANSTSIVNSSCSEIELFRGENNSTTYGTKTNTTAILLKGNSTIELNESQVGYLKGLNNASIVIQESSSINTIKLLDFATLSSTDSLLTDISLFGNSSLNSINDEIQQLSKTATILANESVTPNNLTSYVTQNVNLTGSTISSTKTNIYSGINQRIRLINLSASEQGIDWVYSDNSTSVNIVNSTLPLKGIITSLVNSTDSNIDVRNSIFGHTNLYTSNCTIENSIIVFNGNLKIQTGGNLTITNSSINLNSNYDGELNIEVINGGEMNIFANSTISPFSSFSYSFWVKSGSTFRMLNSFIEGCGYSLPLYNAGLWINASKEVILKNNIIKSKYYGLILERVSDLNVSGNLVAGGKTGIYINNSNTIIIKDNMVRDFQEILQNLSAGIILRHSYNCSILDNILTNITGGNNGKAPSQVNGGPGGTGTGIFLYNSFNNTIENNIINNIIGGTAESGGTKGNGGLGGLGAGIYLKNSSSITFNRNEIINVTGGMGGNGGNNGDGGPGGLGSGVYIENSSFNLFSNSNITTISGGDGGLGGINGVDGPGGDAAGFYVINSSENVITFIVNSISAGEGNPNGTTYNIHLDGGFNDSWAYQTQQHLYYEQNYTVYFGLHNYPTHDTLLLYYHVNMGKWEYEEVTNQQNYTFSSTLLSYGRWEWFIWFNDTASFSSVTPILTFSVYIHVTVDAVSTNSGDSNTFTHSHNVSGTNRLLIVSVQTDGGTSIESITFAGQSLNLITKISHDNGKPNIEVWGLINPPLGIGNVIVSLSGSNEDKTAIGVISYTGVNQTEPIDDINTAQGYNTTPIITVASSAGDLVQDVIASLANGTPTIDSGQSQMWNIEMGGTGASSHYGAGSTKTGTPAVTMSWTTNETKEWVSIGFNIKRTEKQDTTPPMYSDLNHTSASPEYNENNTVSINATDDSGIDTILLYYRVNEGPWISNNVTDTSNYTFNADILVYNQRYDWYFWFNDTEGNINQSSVMTFLVIDSIAPSFSNLIQSNPSPEYNENNTISINVIEPVDASQIDTILVYFENDTGPGVWTDVTSISNYTFSKALLKYNQNYTWFFWFNDTAGNWDQTSNNTFSVGDSTVPTYSDLAQTSVYPEYNESNTVSITVSEPGDASGVDTILLYYKIDDNSFISVNVTETGNYTFNMDVLKFNQNYTWYFWFNDTVGNSGYTDEVFFIVVDTHAPDVVKAADQNTTIPEFNNTVVISINVTEPLSASGLYKVWINYTTDNWSSFTIKDISLHQNHTFSQLVYGQTYNWTIGYNDTAGNTDYSMEFSFTVVDTFAPDVVIAANQNTTTPEFNETVMMSINVTEPINASGLHTVWINYTINNWVTYTIKDITQTQNFTFTQLVYGQIYNWTIGYNDTAGNIGYSTDFSFTVVDSYTPDVITAASQNTTIPEFNETVLVMINVTEPINASGLHKIWINYTTDDWANYIIKDITLTKSFTFSQLVFNWNYDWMIGYNDTAGNTEYSSEFSFIVVDNYMPDVVEAANQTPNPPYEYNDTVVASIHVTEPINASGLHKIWINYTINNWATYTIKDITITQNHTFSSLVYGQSYNWIIGYNDTAGNIDYSMEFSFTVVDTFAPDIVIAANQNTTTPEFNETVMVSINVTESINASGLHMVWINYTINNWVTNTIKDITGTQNHTFTSLVYGQTYNWIIGYNDTVGNTGYSTVFSFTAVDSFAPDVIEPASQTPSPPYQYNDTVIASIYVTEAINASGLYKIWINYTTNNWLIYTIQDITGTQNFTFTSLVYGQAYNWIIGYEDIAGNIGYSTKFSFTVVDSYVPDVIEPASQTPSPPYEFNDTVIASINVKEPIVASGLHKIWINYTLDSWATYTVKEITETQNYAFTYLVYGQTYNWTIGYNDTVGNTGYSNEFSFTVVDNYAPDVLAAASQTTMTPEFNDTVIVSINVTESINASGLHKVWINYTRNNWATHTVKDITLTQNYTFTYLIYGQAYNWTIGYNDTVGNTGYSVEFSFTVVDTFAPDVVIAANQNSTTPEFNETIIVSINVMEPINASGLHKIWINYTTNNWVANTIKDITLTQNHIFTYLMYGQTYNWIIGYNDTIGNTGYSAEFFFTVV